MSLSPAIVVMSEGHPSRGVLRVYPDAPLRGQGYVAGLLQGMGVGMSRQNKKTKTGASMPESDTVCMKAACQEPFSRPSNTILLECENSISWFRSRCQ